ncbi:hypothetical protein ACFLZH_01950 [Patescibacteria group bacterium]
MAEGENKNGQADPAEDKKAGGTGKSANSQVNEPKKKRRRPRRRKKKPRLSEEQKVKTEAGGVSEQIIAEEPPKPKKKRRRRPRKRKKPVEQAAAPAEALSSDERSEEKMKKSEKPKEPIEEEAPAKEEEGGIFDEIGEEAPEEEELTEEELPAEEDELTIEEESTEEEAPVEEELPVEEDELTIEEESTEEEAPVEEELPAEEDELTIEEEPTEEEVPVEEEEFTAEEDLTESTEEGEAAFLAEDKGTGEEASVEEPSASESAPEPVEAAKPPELPEEIAPAEPAKGPVGWDQLKQAIKKDYDETGEQVQEGVPVVPVPVSEAGEGIEEAPAEKEPEAAPQEEQPIEEVQPESVAEVAPAPAATDELAADEAAEKKEIVKIISKYAIGGCAVIAIIAGIFLFKIPQAIIGMIQDIGKDQPVQQQVISTEIPTQPTTRTTKPDTDVSKYEEGVGTAILTGEDIPKIKRVSPSVITSYEIGFPKIVVGPNDRIATYMSVLTTLQNSFATDIHQLLDNSANRSQALEVHLNELNTALKDANDAFEEVNEQKDKVKVLYNEVTTKKNKLEKEFFDSMEKLESTNSNLILEDFINASQSQIELKAEFNALSKISGLFETAMKNMDARIKDIELNKSALVKGVKVIDIKGSDLDLIIQQSELQKD